MHHNNNNSSNSNNNNKLDPSSTSGSRIKLTILTQSLAELLAPARAAHHNLRPMFSWREAVHGPTETTESAPAGPTAMTRLEGLTIIQRTIPTTLEFQSLFLARPG